MKLVNLTLIGADNKISYDFQNKVQGCITPQDIKAEVYQDALSFAFYGGIDPNNFIVKTPVSIELRFSISDEDYVLKRESKMHKGEVLESAILSTISGKVLANEVSTVNAFCLELVGMNQKAFEKLLIIDLDIAEALSADKLTRETVVANQLSGLTTSKEVMTKLENLKEREKQLTTEIESIVPASRQELEDSEQLVKNEKDVVNVIRKDLEVVNKEISKATTYQEELAVHVENAASLEELELKQGEIDEKIEKLKTSNKASAVLAKFQAYEEFLNKTQQKRVEYEKIKSSLKDTEKKISDGENSIESLSEQFIKETRRVEELEKVLNSQILETASGPKSIGIQKIVNGYYAKYDESIKDLVERQKEIEEQFVYLENAIKEQRKRRESFTLLPEYKAAVEDGAVIEGLMEKIQKDIAASHNRIERLSREKSELISQNTENVEKINELKEKVNELNKEICGLFPTQKDAINASVYKHQNLYGKHLLATDLRIEVDAIDEKIEKIQQSSKTYADKLINLRNKRTEIINHREKLQARLDLLNEKMTEYMSFNRLSQVAAEVEYGSHCPVCDGFVSVKKEMPLRNTKALDDQIKAIGAELEKDTRAVIDAENTIGQYEAVLTVSNQYIESLQASKNIKVGQIQKILDEFEVKTVEELAALMHQELDKSKKLMLLNDEFKSAEAELKERTARHNQIVERIKLIDYEDLPFERVVLSELVDKQTKEQLKYKNTVQLLKGEQALGALLKVQAIDKEIYEIDKDIAAKEIQLNAITEEKETLYEKIFAVQARMLPLNYKGKEYSYIEIVTQAFSKHLIAITEEIKKVQEKRNTLKIRIQAVKRVVDDLKKEIEDANLQLLMLESSIKTEEDMVEDIFPGYEKELEDLGVTNLEGLQELVLLEEDAYALEVEIKEYEDNKMRLTEIIKVYKSNLASNEAAFKNLEQNLALHAELSKKEEEALVVLGSSISKAEDVKRRYYTLIEKNQSLSIVQARIKGIEDLSQAIKDGAIISKDLSDLIVSRASANIENMTNGKYTLAYGEDDIIVLSVGDKQMPFDRMQKIEQFMFKIALSFAYNDVLVSLLGGEVVFALQVDTDDLNKMFLRPVLELSQGTDIVVIPEDETIYFKAVSKM